MKKIYILTAVSALLALSLNAQTQLKVGKDGVVVHPKTSTEQVVKQGEKEVIPADVNVRKAPSRASSDPVTPPYTNNFGSTALWNWWEVIDDNSDGYTWTLNSSGYAQYSYNYYNDANDWLITAPVYLEAGKVYTFSINAWIRQYSTSDYESMEVRMAKDVHTSDALSVGKVVIPYTYVTSTSSSNSFSNNKIRVNETGNYYFGIHAVSDANMYYLYVDNLSIGIGADPAHDLKAYVSEPTQIYAGQTATVNAKVTNVGDFAETGYTVKFYANGTEFSSQTVNESLLLGASKMVTAEYTSANAGTVNITATVTCANTDANASNNSATANLSVIAVPAPQNVEATDGDHCGTVTWEAPNIAPFTVTEDFEDLNKFPSFSLGDITATQHTGAIGGWTLYESTGSNVWGSYQEDWENENKPQAWMPFDPTAIESATTTHSGEQFMESICPTADNTASNSWLISPELSGNAQTITFWERVITAAYGDETYEVLASSTDNNPSSFSLVASFHDQVLNWTQRTADLPAGTKYFAIRHTSNDIFGLLIDDITYEIAGEQPVSYNVYLDDNTQPVNVDANTFSNDFSNLTYGSHTCYISAVYAGNLESEKVPATFLSAAKTATPIITYDDTQKGYVTVTATGNGTVTLSVDGQTASSETGTVSIIVVRSPETRNVTATATAKEEEKSESDPATANITIFALPTTSEASLEGLLRMHLVIVDQLEQVIPADNSHPDRYGYVLRYEPNGAGGEGMKESGTVDVKIQKTDCEVLGKYTLEEIDNDKEIGINHDEGLTMDIYSADVKFDLTDDNPDVDFYLLEKETCENPGDFSYVTKLQQTTDFTYVEMLEGSGNDEYPAGPHIYEDEVLTGSLGDYVRYAPVVSTWGLTRRYFESDGKDNTYGAPLWKTGVGEVTMVGMPIAERQHNGWNTEWTDKEGTECSLYILDEVMARGTLPNDYSTVKYEPYMFRIFVESKNGNLRPYTYVPNSTNTGDQIVAGQGTTTGPICVWSGYVNDPKNISEDPETPSINGVTFSINGNEITFEKDKVDRTGGSDNGNNNNGTWDKDSNNAIFGAVRSLTDNATISLNDLSVFVRFYYVVKGKAQGHTPWLTPSTLRGNRDGESGSDPVGYGAESDPGQSRSATAVFEIDYHGEVVGQTYYNIQGMMSEKPFDGVNIVVTRYSDGSTSVAKIVR